MSKEIRFSELVKRAGRPKTATLWTKPTKDQAFMKAVKQNRVLTVVQAPHHSHKDHGEIGFHEQPLAMYLVFPKALPRAADAQVIGLKYELLEEPPVSHPVRPVEPARPAPKPVQKEFEVVVERAALLKTTVHVTAKNRSEASAQALQTVKEQNFDLAQSTIQNKTCSVNEV